MSSEERGRSKERSAHHRSQLPSVKFSSHLQEARKDISGVGPEQQGEEGVLFVSWAERPGRRGKGRGGSALKQLDESLRTDSCGRRGNPSCF